MDATLQAATTYISSLGDEHPAKVDLLKVAGKYAQAGVFAQKLSELKTTHSGCEAAKIAAVTNLSAVKDGEIVTLKEEHAKTLLTIDAQRAADKKTHDGEIEAIKQQMEQMNQAHLIALQKVNDENTLLAKKLAAVEGFTTGRMDVLISALKLVTPNLPDDEHTRKIVVAILSAVAPPMAVTPFVLPVASSSGSGGVPAAVGIGSAPPAASSSGSAPPAASSSGSGAPAVPVGPIRVCVSMTSPSDLAKKVLADPQMRKHFDACAGKEMGQLVDYIIENGLETPRQVDIDGASYMVEFVCI